MAGMMAEYTQTPHLCNHTRFEAQEPPDPDRPWWFGVISASSVEEYRYYKRPDLTS